MLRGQTCANAAPCQYSADVGVILARTDEEELLAGEVEAGKEEVAVLVELGVTTFVPRCE